MSFELCEKRKTLIEMPGHNLVLGGPGSGKTTAALFKAQAEIKSFKPGQKTLFLSFSRPAVQQIVRRCKEVLSKDERSSIEVRTYHAFSWDLLNCHGRLFGGNPLTMMTLGQEALARVEFSGDWKQETQRLFEEDGIVCFDLFAYASALLLERSKHLREKIGGIYPLIILDEFQDTDDDQWRLVKTLSSVSTCLFLADPDQRIYDFRDGVRPERLDILRRELKLHEFDFTGDNYRSHDSDILACAKCVLTGVGPVPKTKDVAKVSYRKNQPMFNSTAHYAVKYAFAELRKRGIQNPTVAVMATSNALVADLSELLLEPHTFNGKILSPVAHQIVWDAELSAAAALVVASTMEFASHRSQQYEAGLLEKVSEYWLIKQDWANRHRGRGAQVASTRAKRFQKAANAIREGKKPSVKAPKGICDAAEALGTMTGSPAKDWKAARSIFQGCTDTNEIFLQARAVRLFHATETLASALSANWLKSGDYVGASQAIRRILDQEKLTGADREPRGCMLMTLHKSKGKEFDGVVIVEGFRGSYLLKTDEAPDYRSSRRLLHVGLTRARKFAVLVRPQGAQPLVI